MRFEGFKRENLKYLSEDREETRELFDLRQQGRRKNNTIGERFLSIPRITLLQYYRPRDRSELIGSGDEGLAVAIEQFDQSRGGTFTSYAKKIVFHYVARARSSELDWEWRFRLGLSGKELEENLESFNMEEKILEAEANKLVMTLARDNLSRRELLIMNSHFGTGDQNKESLRAVAAKLNLSQEGVRKILIKTLKKMRTLIENEYEFKRV